MSDNEKIVEKIEKMLIGKRISKKDSDKIKNIMKLCVVEEKSREKVVREIKHEDL